MQYIVDLIVTFGIVFLLVLSSRSFLEISPLVILILAAIILALFLIQQALKLRHFRRK